MAPGSSSRTPLLPGFAPGTDSTAMRRDGATSRPGENGHEVQDDRPRTPPGTVPGAARAASPGPDAPENPKPVRERVEDRPPRLDGGAPAREPQVRPEPDSQRGARAGPPASAGKFALRVAAGRRRGGDVFARRGDGEPAPNYAARVSAARAAA